MDRFLARLRVAAVVATAFAHKARKMLVGAAGFASTLLAYGVLPAPYDKSVAAVLALLGTWGIYRTPNKAALDNEPKA